MLLLKLYFLYSISIMIHDSFVFSWGHWKLKWGANVMIWPSEIPWKTCVFSCRAPVIAYDSMFGYFKVWHRFSPFLIQFIMFSVFYVIRFPSVKPFLLLYKRDNFCSKLSLSLQSPFPAQWFLCIDYANEVICV